MTKIDIKKRSFSIVRSAMNFLKNCGLTKLVVIYKIIMKHAIILLDIVYTVIYHIK